MNKNLKFSKGFLFTFCAAMFWAISILLIKSIVKSGENSLNIVFWVTVLSLPFWSVVFYRQKEEIKKITAKDYCLLILIGVIGPLFATLVEILALKHTQAINYSFLIRSSLLFTIIFAYLFLGEKITCKKIIISIFLLIGIYFISTNGRLVKFSLGDLLTLLEAVLISFGNTVLGKIAVKRMSTSLSASGSFLVSILPIALLGFLTHSVALPKSLVFLLLLTTSSTIGMTFRFNAYKNASASYVAMIYSFTPVFVTFAAIPFFNEKIEPLQIIGGFLIILSGIFVEKLKID